MNEGQLNPREVFWKVYEQERSKLKAVPSEGIIMCDPVDIENTVVIMLNHQKDWISGLISNMKFGALNPNDPKQKEDMERAEFIFQNAIKPALLNIISLT